MLKLRYLALFAVPFACFSLVGCSSGGVEAVASTTKEAGPAVASAASSGTAPKALPRKNQKGRSETPGPLPAPEI